MGAYSVYVSNIRAAWAYFPVIEVLLTLPYMLYAYRKYGSVSLLRSGILASFLFYLLCAYFLVILPLPDKEKVAALKTPYAQLIPFHFLVDIARESPLVLTQPGTYVQALKQRALWEPIFNVLLTLPFGAYLSYYFRNNLKKTVLFTFLLSLFFELTQLTGLYGIYPRPYRLFDVDDLIINTLGGFIGYQLGSRLTAWLPSRQRMDEKSIDRGHCVSFTRRAFASFADFFLFTMAFLLLNAFLPLQEDVLYVLTFFGYFVGIPLLWHGRTPGKALVRIRVATAPADAPPLWAHLVLKYGLLYLLYCLLLIFELNLSSANAWFGLAVLAGYLLIMLLCFIDWIWSFRHGKRLWYERWSGTENQSTLPPEG